MVKNVQEVKIEVNQCSSKPKCQQKFQDKVKTVLVGMSKTKASHMKQWIDEKFNLPLSWKEINSEMYKSVNYWNK